MTFGDIIFVPFKFVEDIWIEGQVPETIKRLLEIKEEELKAEEFVRSLFDGESAPHSILTAAYIARAQKL